MSCSSIQIEKEVIEKMIRLYCRGKERNAELCPGCRELLQYAHARLDCCPFGDNKRSCRKCIVHCYRQEMRQRIRNVMRYAGPRMLIHAPGLTIRHWFK